MTELLATWTPVIRGLPGIPPGTVTERCCTLCARPAVVKRQAKRINGKREFASKAFELFIGCICDCLANCRLGSPGYDSQLTSGCAGRKDVPAPELAQSRSSWPTGLGCPYARPKATRRWPIDYPNFVRCLPSIVSKQPIKSHPRFASRDRSCFAILQLRRCK